MKIKIKEIVTFDPVLIPSYTCPLLQLAGHSIGGHSQHSAVTECACDTQFQISKLKRAAINRTRCSQEPHADKFTHINAPWGPNISNHLLVPHVRVTTSITAGKDRRLAKTPSPPAPRDPPPAHTHRCRPLSRSKPKRSLTTQAAPSATITPLAPNQTAARSSAPRRAITGRPRPPLPRCL